MKNPLIILDRDGVINYDSDHYIKSPDEWVPIPGSLGAIAQLNRAGYRVVVATNQSGVGRGYYDLETLSHIHEKLMHELAAVGGYIEEIFFCPHHPADNCECRKPKLGMFRQIQAKYGDLSDTYFVGDSFTDVQVAVMLPCKPIFVLSGKGQQNLELHPELTEVPHFVDLVAAVEYVLAERREQE